jgi:phage shock protein A
MLRFIRRFWKYLGAKLNVWHDEHADPQVQLEQAVAEARAQHHRLLDQAAAVLANRRQSEARLERMIAEYEKTGTLAGQALMLADRETRAGNAERAASFTTAAEQYADRLVAMERQIEEQHDVVLQATAAAERAKSAVNQNATAVRAAADRKDAMLSDLDHAKMQEAMNRAEERLSSTLGEHVPTVAEVQRKIDTRLARSRGRAELLAAQVADPDPCLLEVERARGSAAAQARLAALRADLGLPAVTPALELPAPREAQRGEATPRA